MIWRVDLFFFFLNSSFFLSMHVSKYLCTCNCACNLCNLQKQRKRLSLSDLHRLEQCLVGMSDGKRVTSDADGSMAFCAGESISWKRQPDNKWGFFLCVFHFLGPFPSFNSPLPHKTRLGKVFIWPTHVLVSITQPANTSRLRDNVKRRTVWDKPREKDHTELITLAAEQKVDPESIWARFSEFSSLFLMNSKNYSFTKKYLRQ